MLDAVKFEPLLIEAWKAERERGTWPRPPKETENGSIPERSEKSRQ